MIAVMYCYDSGGHLHKIGVSFDVVGDVVPYFPVVCTMSGHSSLERVVD